MTVRNLDDRYCTIPNRLFFAVIDMKYFNLFLNTAERLREPSIHPMRIRLYEAGNF